MRTATTSRDNVVGLHCRIGSTAFRMRIMVEPHAKVVRLRKDTLAAGAEVYHVRRFAGAITCTCPDFCFRREGVGEYCRHIRAMLALGILDPIPAPTLETLELEPKPRSRPSPATPASLADDPGITWRGSDVHIEGIGWMKFEPSPPVLEAIASGGVLVVEGSRKGRHYHGNAARLLALALAQWEGRPE